MRGTRWADDPAAIEAMQRRVPASVGAAFALIEDGMPEGPWVMGERYTIWDPYLFTLAEWLDGDGIDPAKLPRVIEHRTRMWDRAVKQAIAQERD
jgi:glutathione S-transferase